jgi:hypothetical protein
LCFVVSAVIINRKIWARKSSLSNAMGDGAAGISFPSNLFLSTTIIPNRTPIDSVPNLTSTASSPQGY